MNIQFLTTFAQVYTRPRFFLSGYYLVLIIKDGLVECAKVCDQVKSHCKPGSCNENKYSHLSNKHEVMLTDFEKKIHHPCTFPPSTFIDFLDFFHPPLLIYCIHVLVFFPKNSNLQVYSNLLVY